MEKLLDWISENPLWLFVIILFIAITFISSIKKESANASSGSSNGNQNGNQNGNKMPGTNAATANIGDTDKTEVVYGYYRQQENEQVVVKRTDEQQRIVDEYFIVRNIKTTTCNSALKKRAKSLKTASNFLLLPGLAVTVLGFIGSKMPLILIGVVAVITAIILKYLSSDSMKKFEESIKVSVAPKKLMTDEEYEKLVDKKIQDMNIEQLGLEKLGLDPDQVKEIRPIVLRDKSLTKHSFRVYSEKGRSVHSSTQYVTYLYFTDDQLFVYKIQFDMCCNMQDEWAHEFFYKDICDIQSYTYKNILKFDSFSYEYSTVSFNIVSSNSKIGFEIDGANENVGSIQAMKQKIREKKAQ